MAEPLPELQEALQQVAPAWDDARTDRTLQAAQQKRVMRRVRARMVVGAAALCALGSLAYFTTVREAQQQPLADGAPAPSLELADGSRVYAADAGSQVVVQRVSAGLTELNLVRGRARFDVTHNPERRFRVLAGEVVVQVLGTAFEVARSDTGAYVAVTRGRVAVSFPSGHTELGAGEARWFSSAPAVAPGSAKSAAKSGSSASPNAPDEVSVPDDGAPIASKPKRSTAAQGWRQHAEQGDFTRAYALLANDRSHVADDVEELLLAADAARLSGHAGEALPYLRKVSEKHAVDPRAPLAAFTLGSVLMNQLGRPHEAQNAYARARTLAPNGSLAQDALARQVEAAYRAGDPAHARVLALEYLDRYPKGRRVEAVRRFGGLP